MIGCKLRAKNDLFSSKERLAFIMTKQLRLKGLDCANCAAKMERAVQKIDGVENATVSFLTQRLTIEAQKDKQEEIFQKVLAVCKKIEPDCEIQA